MAPIHDTDIANERWKQAEWRYYELWEKVEVRLRKQKRLIVLAAIVVFLILSAVPVFWARWPKWNSLKMARALAQEINEIKRSAVRDHAAYRIVFPANGAPDFRVEKGQSCSGSSWAEVRKGSLAPSRAEESALRVLSPQQGQALGLLGVVHEYCYDHLLGSAPVAAGVPLVGFAVMSVKDLAEARTDRVSLLLVSGTSGELSFE